MKTMPAIIFFVSILLFSCSNKEPAQQQAGSDLEGTWQLVSGTIIEKGDTTVTDYTQASQMIKVINKTHFAFLNHDRNKGKDTTALFVAGGGWYKLNGDQYTEHLEYCSDRAWEGHDFLFTIKIQHDTLSQSGVEKIEGINVNRMNIEKYVRLQR
jgi:hypothetical protein